MRSKCLGWGRLNLLLVLVFLTLFLAVEEISSSPSSSVGGGGGGGSSGSANGLEPSPPISLATLAIRRGGIKGRRRCVFLNDELGTAIKLPVSPFSGEEDENEEEQNEHDITNHDELFVDDEPAITEVICSKDSHYCYSLWNEVNGSKVFTKQGCWEASSNDDCKSNLCMAKVELPKKDQASSGGGETGNENGNGITTTSTSTSTTTTTASPPHSQHPPGTESLLSKKKDQNFYCCCDGDNCNHDVGITYVEASSSEEEMDDEDENGGGRSLPVILIFSGSIMIGLLIIFAGYKYWRRLSLHYNKNRAAGMNGGGGDGQGGIDLEEGMMGGEGKLLLIGGDGEYLEDRNIIDGIQLVVLLARGKFAMVYEGKIPSLSDAPYALKCFTKDQKEFFENEKFVFNYLGKHCNHENIIKYHGWQDFEVGPTTHLILVLDKICPGNLREYLQSVATPSTSDGDENGEENASVLKLADVLRICSGISSGLSYLHGENRDEIVIAHRDLTSKNILLDGETLTPKITDFGLSLVTKGSKYYWAGRERQAEFCSLAEAGTLRYMAPELLEGAVNLKDCENALKQADVYALALIIWEVANCSRDVRLTRPPPQGNAQQNQQQNQSQQQEGTEETRIFSVHHNLPYEEEIGKDNLSMELLTRHVVQYRNRPHFRRWRDTPHTRQLRDTLIESWDAEPDARLTALCIVERLLDIRNIRVKNSDLASLAIIGNNMVSTQQPMAQTPLESPSQGQGLFGSDYPAVIDAPWTGRNPCLQRNLLTATASSNGGGGGGNDGGGSTSGSSGMMMMGGLGGGGVLNSDSNLEHHHLLLNYDYKNQANLNYYHNYVGGSSGGASYSSTSTTSAGGGGNGGGNSTEMSNVSSINDGHDNHHNLANRQNHPLIDTRYNPNGGQNGGQGQGVVQPPPLPPTIPFVQNLHA
ncbi:unnamed protein product [Orchesella dallaii]|uniref:receptor protein serine/threonine kinase n=1 Tax=Orchesella dallaii TaxID=48710 RepID=A0ABP1PJQ5_9HEXA